PMTVPMRIRRHRRRSPTSAAARRFTTTRWRFALDSKRQFLRHTLATLAYRGGKVVHDAPENFSEFSAGHRTRTAGNILAHICDLLDWACSMARGRQTWKDVPPRSWNEDVDRFFAGLKRLDSLLADDEPLGFEAEKLFQGPDAERSGARSLLFALHPARHPDRLSHRLVAAHAAAAGQRVSQHPARAARRGRADWICGRRRRLVADDRAGYCDRHRPHRGRLDP